MQKFDEIPLKTLKDIKETKRYGRTDELTDNVKTVYPPTNTVCGGYNNMSLVASTEDGKTAQVDIPVNLLLILGNL